MLHVHAWAIRYGDQFWEGDVDAPDEGAFGPLSAVRAFPERKEAEQALEVLDLDEAIREQCRIVKCTIAVE
jgi:hypothetical protein